MRLPAGHEDVLPVHDQRHVHPPWVSAAQMVIQRMVYNAQVYHNLQFVFLCYTVSALVVMLLFTPPWRGTGGGDRRE